MVFRNIKISRGIWVILVFLSSCAHVKTARFQHRPDDNYCNQQTGFHHTIKKAPLPLHEMKLDTAVLARFSFKSLNVANAFGILELLTAFIQSEKSFQQNPSVENRLAKLELSQRIDQQINLSSLEISSVASELDCEEERIKQVADYIKGAEDANETKLTVAAIVVGATGAAASGLLLNSGDEGEVSEYIGIASAITEAALGGLILLNQKKVDYFHPRNALREIWEGRDSTDVFPPSVWYYLNYFNPENPAEKSLRYQIIESWMGFGQIEKAASGKKRRLIELYFGKGGKYTTAQLYNRANMYDQLESYVKIIKQDLMMLSVELERIK